MGISAAMYVQEFGTSHRQLCDNIMRFIRSAMLSLALNAAIIECMNYVQADCAGVHIRSRFEAPSRRELD
jgi:hypothetical protein